MVEHAMKSIRVGHPHERFKDMPKFGVVSTVHEIPWFTMYPHAPERQRDYKPALHYVDVDGVHYFPHVLMEGEDHLTNDLFRTVGASYHSSPSLLKAMWKGMVQYEPPFPEVPGMELVTYEEKEKELKFLAEHGFHVQMAGFTPKNVPLGTSRLLSIGFVARFGFPGEETRLVNRFDVSVELIRRIEEGQSSSREATVVDTEDVAFLRGLKDMCYSVQSEHGPFAAKYAWEVYKRTARHLTSSEEQVS
jgi:hypothetical protein